MWTVDRMAMYDKNLSAVALVALSFTSVASAAVHDVGPGKRYTSIGAAPWSTLMPGDVVNIYWRAEPYVEKWLINRSGAAGKPITVRGIPSARGELPVIDGNNARTPAEPEFWNEDRGVIKIGGGAGVEVPSYINIEQLDLMGGRLGNFFYTRSGARAAYIENAAGLFVERGTNINIRRCIFRENGDGLFLAGGAQYQTRDILVERNYFHDNGYVGSDQHHNVYANSINVVYQYNRLIMKANQQGNNLKDRSANCVIRYNWVEGGNRQLDIVQAYVPEIINQPGYHDAYAYGNILIDYRGYDNPQITNFGGDSPDLNTYRRGTFYFYNNTIISYRADETEVVRVGHPDGRVDMRNNLVHAPLGPLKISEMRGTVDMRNNLLKPGWTGIAYSGGNGVVNDLGGNVASNFPGFLNEAAQDFRIASDSPAVNRGAKPPAFAMPLHDLTTEYVRHSFFQGRLRDGILDIGAFEYVPLFGTPMVGLFR